MSRILVSSFGVTGFRTFDQELQPLKNLQAINLFVGRNNSGKSNVISALQLFCLAFASPGQPSSSEAKLLQSILTDPLNRPMAGKVSQPAVWLPSPSTAADILEGFVDWHYRSSAGTNLSVQDAVGEILTGIRASVGTQGFVSAYPGSRNFELSQDKLMQGRDPRFGQPEVYRALFEKYSGHSGGSLSHWIEFFLRRLDPFPRQGGIKFIEVPSVRKVIDAGTAFDGTFGDQKLISTLAEWERPDAQNLQHHADKFRRLLEFVRTVLEDSNVELQVPYRRDTIHVVKDGKTLPIERLGTGIHQVVMLAAAATVVDNSVVAIEEPETNLHPSLQRKLIRYLGEQTSNQYFITTHSAHVLDAVQAAIFQVGLVDGVTRLTPVSTPTHRFSAVEDLGYRASDLIQSPIVIWVEGPSDRIYLVAWFKCLNPDLVEGTHYSIMFYGGRLLSHLQADDPEVDEFISLRRLNRYVALLIDSDRKGPTSKINATKTRLVEEIERAPTYGLAWVTEGREIENYLEEGFLGAAIKDLARDFVGLPIRAPWRFKKSLDYIASDGSRKSVADRKVSLARAYLEKSRGAVPSTGSLKAQLQSLIELIKRANGLA